MKTSAGEDKFRQMTHTPVGKLVCIMAAPAILVMLSTSLYNMADTFFVGRLGTSATAAVGISFPLMYLIQAGGFMLGMGGGNYISRLLGEKKREEAALVLNTSFFSAICLGLLFTLGGLLFLRPLLSLLGASPRVLPYAAQYIGILLLGAPLWMAALTLNITLRFQGFAFYGMIGMVGGNLLNIALDPLFIFTFGLGIAGAGWATVLSQTVTFVVLLVICGRGDNMAISLGLFRPSAAMYKRILGGGAPSLLRQGLGSLAAAALNLAAAPFGDAAIAAMSIVTRLNQLAISVLLGFGQGFQPVCGFNYGAKRYDRVLAAFFFCVKVGFITLCCCSLTVFFLAPEIIALFRPGDKEVIAIGGAALRYQALTMPLFAWIVVNNMLLQAIGKNFRASLLAVARQGLFFLPLVLTLPPVMGLVGLQISQPLADMAAFGLSLALGWGVLKEIRRSASYE